MARKQLRMSAPGVLVEVDMPDLDAAIAALDSIAQVANREYKDAMYHATGSVQNHMSEVLGTVASQNNAAMRSGMGSARAPANPAAVVNLLSSKVEIEGAGSVVGRVGGNPNRNAYWQMIEAGRAPFRVPNGVIIKWAERVLGKDKKEANVVGRAVAAAIRSGGILPTPVRERTMNDLRGKLETIFKGATDRIAQEIANKVNHGS